MEFGVGEDHTGQFLHGLGYSLEHNPDFRYCAEEATTREPATGYPTYWLDSCGLTSGASGGPWVANMDEDTGVGTIVSVNAWSYTTRAGMGGPIIEASQARCLVNYARSADFDEIEARGDAQQGDFVYCDDRPCIPADEVGDSARKLRGGRRLCAE